MLSARNIIITQTGTVLEIRKDTGDVIKKNFCRIMSSENCVTLIAE